MGVGVRRCFSGKGAGILTGVKEARRQEEKAAQACLDEKLHRRGGASIVPTKRRRCVSNHHWPASVEGNA